MGTCRRTLTIGFNPFKEAEKKAKSAVNSVVDKVLKPAVRDAERKADSLSSGIERKAKSVANAAEDKIDDVRDKAVAEVRKAGHEVEDGLTEKLPDLIEEGLQELAEKASEEAAEKALEAALDVVEMLAPDEITVTLGMELALVVQGEVTVQVTIPNPVAKTTEIRKWADNPPKGRAEIIECVGDFAPSSVSAEFKVSGNGVSASWSTGDKLEKLDKFLAKHGVD